LNNYYKTTTLYTEISNKGPKGSLIEA